MLKYKQISIEEREKIYQFLKTDISLTKIAAHLLSLSTKRCCDDGQQFFLINKK